MNSYYIIGNDGKSYGPVDQNGLIQWTREGRVSVTSQIRCVEMEKMVNAGELPFLVSVIARPAAANHVAAGKSTDGQLQLSYFPVIAILILHFMTLGIFSVVWLNLLHGKLPKKRADDPSAGRAVGFCFIPFFNFYWIFFTYRRLCLRIDEQRELSGLPPSNLRGMATTACIFLVIPSINILIGYTIISPIFIGMMQSSVNQLVQTTKYR
jgi:hypothetical protein